MIDKSKFSESEKNTYVLIRTYVCRTLCDEGSTICQNLECIEYFLKIAGIIEQKIDDKINKNLTKITR